MKMKKKVELTPMLRRYIIKLGIRVAVFLGILVTYLVHKEWLVKFITQSIGMGITPLHVLWLGFMLMMLYHLFPHEKLSMALRKAKKEVYIEVPGYSELELLRYVQDQNQKAWFVMLVWLIGNFIVGILHLIGVLDASDLLMLTVFYFLCDYICILFYCPFQSGIMKNKCCVNCRIFDWGHFMMFTPMLFIKSFFSWSLFVTSFIVLIHWEIVYARHPERFWSGSNQVLQCGNCKDKTCQIKNRVRRLWTSKPSKADVEQNSQR